MVPAKKLNVHLINRVGSSDWVQSDGETFFWHWIHRTRLYPVVDSSTDDLHRSVLYTTRFSSEFQDPMGSRVSNALLLRITRFHYPSIFYALRIIIRPCIDEQKEINEISKESGFGIKVESLLSFCISHINLFLKKRKHSIFAVIKNK